MNTEETKQILAVLKAAYPSAYKDQGRDALMGILNLWTAQLANIPYGVVSLAVNGLIKTSKFLPSIAEVYDQIALMQKNANAGIMAALSIGEKPSSTDMYLYRALENVTINQETHYLPSGQKSTLGLESGGHGDNL